VLDAVEALLLRGGDELTVDHEGRGGVAVVGVQAEDRSQARILGRLRFLSDSVQEPFRHG
jgi:hypothetical protein